MYLLLLFLFLPETVVSHGRCGGRYTAARGIITTPNFPKRFPTPIRCKWIIDAQNFSSENSSIIVYFTQLFVSEGLNFTEYQIYDDRYQLNPGGVHVVNEDNVSNVSYLQYHTDYLVITLNLDNVESSHLRVLDGLLDVYGFNITYEITNKTVRKDICTMRRCGFTGNCYDHFTHFSCDCFPGFSGRICSEGEKSRCYRNGIPVCKNGGTCMHLGDNFVHCACRSDFTGAYCDIPKQPTRISVKENSLKSCPFDGTLENVCKCGNSQTNYSATDLIGFTSNIIISNMTTRSTNENDLKLALTKYIVTLMPKSVQEFQIPYLKLQNYGTELTFQFFGPKADEKLIRNVVNKWSRYGKIGNVTLLERDFFLRTDPYLNLQSVSINNELIRENDEFILSCVARGSRNMIFRWFKNGVPVNITRYISNKWTKLIDESKERYSALLGIERATRFDEGIFTCQVEDYGMQQCMSKKVRLKHRPTISLNPMSLTVRKGESFSIKCLNDVAQYVEKYIYSWTKDKVLLPKRTETEHYEVLYPGGSILQVTGINKTAIYSCLAQDGKLSFETSVTVNVIDKSVVTPCPWDHYDEISWPETAPGTSFKHRCPKNYTGIITRSCIMLENMKPKWLPPDYSNCTAFELLPTIRDFQILTQGYEKTSPLDSLMSISSYLSNRSLLRGEGAVVLELAFKIWRFNNLTRHSEGEEVSAVIFDIVDYILDQAESLNKEQQVLLLQRLIKRQLLTVHRISRKSLRNIIVTVEDFNEPLNSILTSPEYIAQLSSRSFNKKSTITRIIYKNLYQFLPFKSIIRLSDDREIEYEIMSSIIGVWLNGGELDLNGKYFYHAAFSHEPVVSRLEWDLRCALAEYASSNYAWDTKVCYSKSLNISATECYCSEQGTMALLLVKEPKMESAESSHPHDLVILIGSLICLILSVVCGIILLCNWFYRRSSFTFLKIQCCFSLSGCMALFIVAFNNNLPKEVFLYIVSFLQAFFFMGMSSQLSILLIIYSELVEIQTKESIKQTVVGIITGAPLLVVFGCHLAHRSTDIQLNFWWLIKGTLSFNVFISCTVIMCVLFLMLYVLVIKLIQGDKNSGSRFLNNRAKLMKRAFIVFYSIIILSGFSIVCVNILQDVLWHYLFSASCIIMGFLVVICLLWRSQFITNQSFMEKFKLKPKNSNVDISSPQKCPQDASCQELPTLAPSPSIQQYNSSPTQLNPIVKSSSLTSPDILGANTFAELDLVASSLQSAKSPSAMKKNNVTVAISKAFDEPLKIASDIEVRVEGEGKSSEGLDAVMDSISNDLNYLLNGHDLKEQEIPSRSTFFDDSIPC